MVLGSGFIEFDPSKIKTAKPGLGEAKGYRLSQEELLDIFGVDGSRFGELPGRIVVPVLEGHCPVEGHWTNPYWHVTTGYLYLVEPAVWIPQIMHGETIPVSKFVTEHTTEIKNVSETTFNAATSASLDIEGGGSYLGVSANVKSSSTIEFKVSTSSSVTEATKTIGTTGDVPVHELMLYPILRCKVIKKQRIEYKVTESGYKLIWGHNDYDDKAFWEARRVVDGRVDGVRKLAYHPVPMSGNNDLASVTYLLPVPQVTSDGDLEVTTLLSRSHWADWYHYDIAWEDRSGSNETIDVAAPNNAVAFRPMATWTVLKGPKDESKGEPKDKPRDESGDKPKA